MEEEKEISRKALLADSPDGYGSASPEAVSLEEASLTLVQQSPAYGNNKTFWQDPLSFQGLLNYQRFFQCIFSLFAAYTTTYIVKVTSDDLNLTESHLEIEIALRVILGLMTFFTALHFIGAGLRNSNRYKKDLEILARMREAY